MSKSASTLPKQFAILLEEVVVEADMMAMELLQDQFADKYRLRFANRFQNK